MKKYGYQEGFPTQNRSFLMPEEVCKLVRDQDQDGEFYDSIEDGEDLVEEQIHEESCQEKEDPSNDEALAFARPFDEDIQSRNMANYNSFENFDDALFHDYEERCQKDLDEVSFIESLNETLLSAFPFEEDEVVQSCEEVINSYDADELMEQPLDLVDDHIDMFIQTGRHRWDFGRLIFDRDPIYDIEGSS
jgi:hypothetical protein